MAKLLFVGDVVLTSGEWVTLSDEVKHIFSQHDIRCCNFEGTLAEEGIVPIDKIGPTIKQSDSAVDIVESLGFNLACLANNHICDYGKSGLSYTLKKFENIRTIGAGIGIDNIYSPCIVNLGNQFIGIINSAENGFGCASEDSEYGYAWIFDNRLKDTIAELRKKCSFVIFICHAGLENVNYPLPEWRRVYHDIIDCGVDAIVAHHPHVVQGWEEYHGRMIFYSLGNFIWQKSKVYDNKSIMVSLDVQNGCLADFKIYYVQYNNCKIELSNDATFSESIKGYCDILKNNDRYLKIITDECTQLYESQYQFYYSGALNIGRCIKLKSRIKNGLKIILHGIKKNNLFLYHNIAIETHIWTCQRALRAKLKQEGKYET